MTNLCQSAGSMPGGMPVVEPSIWWCRLWAHHWRGYVPWVTFHCMGPCSTNEPHQPGLASASWLNSSLPWLQPGCPLRTWFFCSSFRKSTFLRVRRPSSSSVLVFPSTYHFKTLCKIPVPLRLTSSNHLLPSCWRFWHVLESSYLLPIPAIILSNFMVHLANQLWSLRPYPQWPHPLHLSQHSQHITLWILSTFKHTLPLKVT